MLLCDRVSKLCDSALLREQKIVLSGGIVVIAWR